MRVPTLATAIVMALAAVPFAQSRQAAPEVFTANLHVAGATGGAAAATITIDVTRYTPDADRTAVEAALKTGGFDAFVAALRKAPAAGVVRFGEKTWTIRWAREQQDDRYRTLTFVTDSPIFFVGGGSVEAKPRAGYDVALIQLRVDGAGLGDGTMAAAARVGAGGASGVQVDDYADKPIKLVTVVRRIQ